MKKILDTLSPEAQSAFNTYLEVDGNDWEEWMSTTYVADFEEFIFDEIHSCLPRNAWTSQGIMKINAQMASVMSAHDFNKFKMKYNEEALDVYDFYWQMIHLHLWCKAAKISPKAILESDLFKPEKWEGLEFEMDEEQAEKLKELIDQTCFEAEDLEKLTIKNKMYPRLDDWTWLKYPLEIPGYVVPAHIWDPFIKEMKEEEASKGIA